MISARSAANRDPVADFVAAAPRSVPEDGHSAGDVAGLLERVAIVRGPGRAAFLVATELARDVKAEGGTATELYAPPYQYRWAPTAGGLIDASAFTLVVEIGASKRAAERLAGTLHVPLIEASSAPGAGFGAALRRALEQPVVRSRPLLDVDVDGARTLTSQPVDLHADGGEVTVAAGERVLLVTRDVRVLPGDSASYWISIQGYGSDQPVEQPERAKPLVVAAAGRVMHVRGAGDVDRGQRVTFARRAPLVLLAVEELVR